jgi:hypothetical protein
MSSRKSASSAATPSPTPFSSSYSSPTLTSSRSPCARGGVEAECCRMRRPYASSSSRRPLSYARRNDSSAISSSCSSASSGSPPTAASHIAASRTLSSSATAAKRYACSLCSITAPCTTCSSSSAISSRPPSHNAHRVASGEGQFVLGARFPVKPIHVIEHRLKYPYARLRECEVHGRGLAVACIGGLCARLWLSHNKHHRVTMTP